MSTTVSSSNRGILDSPTVKPFDALITIRAKDRYLATHRDLFEAITSYNKFRDEYGFALKSVCLVLPNDAGVSYDFLYALANLADLEVDENFEIYVDGDNDTLELVAKSAPKVKILDATLVPVFGPRLSPFK